jgi:hypothetical protein
MLCAVIPVGHAPLGIQHEDCVLPHVLHEQAKAVLDLVQPLREIRTTRFRSRLPTFLGHVEN